MKQDAKPENALASAVCVVAAQLSEDLAGPVITKKIHDACAEPNSPNVLACAQLLLRVGFTGQAEILYQAHALCFPGLAAGAVGLAHVAMERKCWTRALARWSHIISTYSHQSQAYFLSARARVLSEIDRTDEARTILEDLVRDFPDLPSGLVGLAFLAMQERCWGEALKRWDEVLALFPNHDGGIFAKVGRATALIELARYAEAEASLREVIEVDPWLLWAQSELMRLLVLCGQPEQALSWIENGTLANVVSPKLVQRRIQVLLPLRRLDAARSLFVTLLQRAIGLDAIVALFRVAPELYEGRQLTETWLELLRQLDQIPDPIDVEEHQIFDVARARIQLALQNYREFLSSATRAIRGKHLGRLGTSLSAVATAVEAPSFPDFQKPKVLGIGLSRTGTTSLTAALSALGLSTAHWQNPLTYELISEKDLHLFDALLDTPVCMEFEKFYYEFPASKFIYTIRPLETWIRSVTRLWQRTTTIFDFREFQQAVSRPASFRFGSRFCEIKQALYLNHASLVEAYAAYDRRVRSFFADKPKERFLIFDIFAGQGWPELCAFLGTDPPAIPFPHENSQPADPRKTVG